MIGSSISAPLLFGSGVLSAQAQPVDSVAGGPEAPALITNDAVVLALLLGILAFVFWTSSLPSRFWRKFYSIVPSLLLCYFLPSLLSTFGVVSAEESRLYHVASRYLLPASLALLTLSTDIPGILRLGPKALVLFLTGTAGVIAGGPLAVLLVSLVRPDFVGGVGPDAVWRGLTTVAGSWIGGGANQAAMKEVFEVGDSVFSAMVAVDVLVANAWMAFLLFLAGRSSQIDRRLGADTSAIDTLRDAMSSYQAQVARIPKAAEIMLILAVGFGTGGFAHFVAGWVAPWIRDVAPELSKWSLTSEFFWIVALVSALGVGLSFTRVRRLEGAGASKIGTVLLFVLVATIGMRMDLGAVAARPELFLVGGIWILIHGVLLITVAYFIRAPVFLLAVGSQANIGGAASAPIVASAFHPALAPVGALLAVLGYALGTYGAWYCGYLMEMAAP